MSKIPDVSRALSRRNRERLQEIADKKKADAAIRRVHEKHGEVLSKKDEPKKKKKAPKQSQAYLDAKSAYETAKETGGHSREELRKLWQAMKKAEKEM